MNLYIAFCLLASLLAGLVSSEVIKVHDVHSLQNALKHVQPGDTIQLEDGEYHGVFKASITGTADKPIVMSGSKKATISSTSYGLHLTGCSYWTLRGFTIHNSKKGLVLDESNHNLIENLEIHHIDEEGVHLRSASSDNTLQKSFIHHTGLKRPGFGEGVYIGSAV